MYAGYGDWFANTGPSEMCRLTPPATSFVCEFTFWDEMAIIFRPLNNKLYVVGKDPHGPNNHAYAVKSGSSWLAKGAYSLGTLPVIHPFDMAAFAGSCAEIAPGAAASVTSLDASSISLSIELTVNGGSEVFAIIVPVATNELAIPSLSSSCTLI